MFDCHKHHIVPKHAGGTNDPSNLVWVTIPEHAELHRVLYEQYGRLGDKMAWHMLSGKTEEGELVRIELSRTPEARARRSAAAMGNNHCFGRKNALGCKHTLEANAKKSADLMGHSVSFESRKKMSEAQMGNKNAVGHVGRGGRQKRKV